MNQRLINLLTFTGFSSILKVFIGLQLLNPFTNTFASSIGFSTLASMMSEEVLGIIFLIVGVHHFAVFLATREGENSVGLLAIRILSFLLFGAFAISLFLGNKAGIGSITFATIAIFEGIRIWIISGRRENKMI